MKKKWIATALVLGFSLGYGTTYARHHMIPGVDMPFDPANYWTMDTISAPDSAPSEYALRDLANQGGQVYDHTRHLKAIDIALKFLEEFGIRKKQTKIAEDNAKPLDDATRNALAQNEKEIGNKISGAGAVSLAREDALYDRASFEGEATQLDDRSQAQSQAMAERALEAFQKANAIDDASAQIKTTLENALQASSSAEGKRQALEAIAHIRALKKEAQAGTTALWALLENADGAQKRQVADDQAIDNARLNDGAMTLDVLDHSDPMQRKMAEAALKAYGEKIYESAPMPSFQSAKSGEK